MKKSQYTEYRELHNHGVQVTKENSVKFNAGGESESPIHIVAKSLSAMVLLENGYRVSSEVEVPKGEIDIVGWGNPDRLTLAVEAEQNVSDDVVRDKLDRYVGGTPIDDLVVLDLDDMHPNVNHSYGYIKQVLGL